MTKNQSPQPQRHEHFARHHTSNAIIKVLLDSGSDDDLVFHDKGTPMHLPYLIRQVSTSWHRWNENFFTKGWSEVNLKFFEYSNCKVYGNTIHCAV